MAFFVSLIGIVTGLVFILIVTRSLSPEEFGTWSLIGSMIGYVMVSESIINFWTTREIARGKNIGKSSLFPSIGVSFALIPIYLVISSVLSNESNALTSSMYFGLILVFIITYMISILVLYQRVHQLGNFWWCGLIVEEIKKFFLNCLM